MRILFLAPANSIHTVRWVNALAERGHEIHLASLANHKKDKMIISSVNVYKLPVTGVKGYYLNALILKKLVEKITPDVINVHYASGYGTLMRIARLKQTVLSVWGSDVYDFPYQNRTCMKIIQKNLNYAKMIASTSNCMAEQTRKILGRNVNISITPFGIETEEYLVKKDNSYDNIVIGTVKTLEPKYGIDDLIRTISILKNKLVEDGKGYVAEKIRCKIYGDGKQKEELLKLLEELNLKGIVTLEGKIPHEEVPRKLAQMDIFVALSVKDSESFGVAAVEASAVGLPVVLSDVDGFKEVAEDGITGIIVKRKSPEIAAEALIRLVLDSELRKKMGEAGRKRVEKLYDWEQNVSQMEECYKQVAEKRQTNGV